MLNCRFTCFFVKEDPASHCVDHRLRLLKDLLLHERFKVACTEEACAQMRSQAGKYEQAECVLFSLLTTRGRASLRKETRGSSQLAPKLWSSSTQCTTTVAVGPLSLFPPLFCLAGMTSSKGSECLCDDWQMYSQRQNSWRKSANHTGRFRNYLLSGLSILTSSWLKAAHFLTFHNLLQLHLQSLDGSHRILAGLPVHPVDGELPAAHHGDVVVLHVQHLVGVLDDGAAGEAHTELNQPPPRSQRAILMQIAATRFPQQTMRRIQRLR